MEIVWPGQNYMWGRKDWAGDLVLSKKTTYSCSSMIYRWPEKKKEIMQLFKYSCYLISIAVFLQKVEAAAV